MAEYALGDSEGEVKCRLGIIRTAHGEVFPG